MHLQIINTEKKCQDMLELVDYRFDLNIAPESKEGGDLQIALLLIKQYEDFYVPAGSLEQDPAFPVALYK